jgi:hypothetical protein
MQDILHLDFFKLSLDNYQTKNHSNINDKFLQLLSYHQSFNYSQSYQNLD